MTNKVRVLYLCSGRSFYYNNLNRKIFEAASSVSNNGHDIKIICGGDIYANKVEKLNEYGAQSTYSRWYKKQKWLQPVVTSLSEWRDIKHDKFLYSKLQDVYESWKPDIIWERSSRLQQPSFCRRHKYKPPGQLPKRSQGCAGQGS